MLSLTPWDLPFLSIYYQFYEPLTQVKTDKPFFPLANIQFSHNTSLTELHTKFFLLNFKFNLLVLFSFCTPQNHKTMVESHYHIVTNAQKNNPRSVNQHIWIIKFFTKCLKGLSKTPNSDVSVRGHIFKCFFPITEHWPFFCLFFN